MNQSLIETDTTTILGKPYNVVLFNDDSHDMMQVVNQIRKATGCDNVKATTIMLEAHTAGRAIAYSGSLERCEHVESVLSEIQLGTKIEQA
jgi:ATP-dependent Clp protease adapter protein ClpS